jgi:hypothetical protein
MKKLLILVISMYLAGNAMSFTDQEPQIKNVNYKASDSNNEFMMNMYN